MSGTLKILQDDYSSWVCHTCNEPLQLLPAKLRYMNSVFEVELPTCPRCHQVLIPEDLALGKMAQVEQLLEDK